MKNKFSLTVAIPTYNEEVNIENIVRSVFRQKRQNFELSELLVYSDASTDKTNLIVRKLTKKYKKLKIVVGRKRMGKYYRVGQAFLDAKSDVLVVLDADIQLVGDLFLTNLVKGFASNENLCMISAHQIPLRPKDFIDRILYTSFIFWDFVRLGLPNLDNPHNFYGSATAYKKIFYSNIRIPRNMKDPHLYIYMASKRYGEFSYCFKAKVKYWPISTITDMEYFIKRSIGKRDDVIYKTFGVTTEEIYFLPLRYKLLGLAKCFLKYPFYTPLALYMLRKINKKARYFKEDESPVWKIMESTKKSFHKAAI